MLRTYHHTVPSIQMTHQDIMWVTWYAHQAIQAQLARGKEVKDKKGKASFLKAQKLCSLAFARHFGLIQMWQRNHSRVSLWPPDTDFMIAGNDLRIAGVPAREGKNFGANLRARVWEKDFERGHTGYVLACWYPPYVDLVGWLPRDKLKSFKEKWWYQLEESIVRPVSTIPGLTQAK